MSVREGTGRRRNRKEQKDYKPCSNPECNNITVGVYCQDCVRSGIRRQYSREDIIKALQADALLKGRPPRAVEWVKPTTDRPTKNQVKKEFGGWTAALKAAGFEPRKQGANKNSGVKKGTPRHYGSEVEINLHQQTVENMARVMARGSREWDDLTEAQRSLFLTMADKAISALDTLGYSVKKSGKGFIGTDTA